jgi:uncharacterized protein YndB with AHSA1/START domain
MTATSEAGATTFTTPSDLEIRATRVFDAPRELIFDAWTKPEHLPNWMTGPDGWSMPVCEVDLRVGGAWRFVWRRDDGGEMEITPPERLVATESWGGDWPETVNTLVLTEEAGRTTVTQTTLFPSVETRDAALESGMKNGMNLSFTRLAAYLARTTA